ncbi:MAG: sugar phosphate isomerase/epimerase [Armatimonadetes bacterium]|nr:sugar phosphate isomerase/epimerase [Armatimonadota bacterium]
MKVGVITASWVYKLSDFDATTAWGVAQGRFEESWGPEDLDDLLGTVKSLGFDWVELWRATGGFERWSDEQLAAVKGSLEKHGVGLAAYCVGGIEPDSDIEGLFSYAHRLGATLCTGYLSNGDVEQAAARIAEAGERYGVCYGVENHGPEHTVSTPEDILELAKRYPGRIGACPDTGIYYRGGVDPLAVVEALKDVVIHMHLKDVDDSGQCAVGEGKVPMTEIITLLRDSGYSGVYSVEREGAGDPAPLLKRSAAFIKSVLSS